MLLRQNLLGKNQDVLSHHWLLIETILKTQNKPLLGILKINNATTAKSSWVVLKAQTTENNVLQWEQEFKNQMVLFVMVAARSRYRSKIFGIIKEFIAKDEFKRKFFVTAVEKSLWQKRDLSFIKHIKIKLAVRMQFNEQKSLKTRQQPKLKWINIEITL